MPTVPKKVHERIFVGVKQFQSILATTEPRDVNEKQFKGSAPFNFIFNFF